MERYSKYKDSGVDWIGEIPAGWNITRFGRACSSNLGKMLTTKPATGDSFKARYLKAANVQEDGIHLQPEQEMYFSEKEKSQFMLRKGDLLVVEGGSVGLAQVWHSPIENCYIQNALHRVRPTNDFEVRFLKYSLDAARVSGYINLICSKATIAHFTGEKLSATPLLKPTLSEQCLISDYLDRKTAEIDEAAADIEQSIKLLNEYRQSVISEAVTKGLDPNAPMKDSGINWIGQIPEYWHTEKAKFLVSITNGSDPKTNGNIPVYGSGEGSFKTCGEYKEGPAVLIGRKGATLHIPHYVTGKYWNVDTAFDVKATSNTINLRYYYYLATCFDYKQYMSQTTLPSMTQTAYWNMALPLPDTAEQNHIVDWLDEHLSQIDSLIAQKQSLIVRLKEYRSSLISECVTGKVKVPGVKED